MKGNKKPWETVLIEKILDVISYGFPGEEKKAVKEFEKNHKNELNAMQTQADFDRGFESWFLLQYLLKNKITPMEFVSSNPANYFLKKEINMIGNFLDNINSLFEINKISKDKKDYTVQNIADDKSYLVKTIDFPPKASIGKFIHAILVKDIEGNYFFYGNVMVFSRGNGQKVKKIFLEELEKVGGG